MSMPVEEGKASVEGNNIGLSMDGHELTDQQRLQHTN